MSVELPGMIHRGVPLDDVAILERLPPEYAQLLAQRNGFVVLRGGLHVRGACRAPAWHSIRAALEGDAALHRRFAALLPTDIPFAQDALGNQFVLRRDEVHRLAGETGAIESLDVDLTGFLARATGDPLHYLGLQALSDFLAAGGVLAPGELLHAVMDGGSPTFRAVPASERIRALADVSRRKAAR